jgi:hypothetical protein
MAGIELVIRIPEDEYKNILLTGKASFRTVNAIESGTPLPKGHGRLIDEDTIAGDGSWDWSDRLDATPTIIEADGGDAE